MMQLPVVTSTGSSTRLWSPVCAARGAAGVQTRSIGMFEPDAQVRCCRSYLALIIGPFQPLYERAGEDDDRDDGDR